MDHWGSRTDRFEFRDFAGLGQVLGSLSGLFFSIRLPAEVLPSKESSVEQPVSPGHPEHNSTLWQQTSQLLHKRQTLDIMSVCIVLPYRKILERTDTPNPKSRFLRLVPDAELIICQERTETNLKMPTMPRVSGVLLSVAGPRFFFEITGLVL